MGAGEKRAAEVPTPERGTKRSKPGDAATGSAGASGSESSPPVFKKGSECGYTLDADSGFYMHESAQWMYNDQEHMYVHLSSGSVWNVDEASGEITKMNMDVPELPSDGGPPRATGVVSWFNPKKQFGFLQTPSYEGDLFVHQNQVLDDTKLAEGVGISFVVETGDDGRSSAAQVRLHKDGGDEGDDAETMEEVVEGDDVDDDDDEGEDVDLDLFKDTEDFVSAEKGPEKIQIEDRCLEKTRIPVGLAGDSDATALLFGVYDGHGGDKAAEYMLSHLPTNFISCMRQRKQGISNVEAVRVFFS